MILLRELAFDRKRIIREIDYSAFRFFEHLLELYYYRDAERDVSRWIGEIRAYMGSIPKLKNGKLPDENFIFKALWSDRKDSFEDNQESYIIDFNYELKDYTTIKEPSEFAKDFCEDYCRWLSRALSIKGNVSIPEVRKEIEVLWKKFPYKR